MSRTDVSINEHNIRRRRRRLVVCVCASDVMMIKRKVDKVCECAEEIHIKQIIVKCNKLKINIRATLNVIEDIIALPSEDEMTFGAGVRL